MMWNLYTDKVVFITGASGFLGTALVYRLVTQAPVAHIYILCRGGRESLVQKWNEHLAPDTVKKMTDPRLVTVLEGDMLQPDMGLSSDDLALLHQRVNMIMHCASSIALRSSLKKLLGPTVEASERLAHIALQCDRLETFVYVSSAYANSFLFPETDGTSTVRVQEALYPLYDSEHGDTDGSLQQELREVRQTGSSTAYQSHEFLWAYAYAKHLTERLLTCAFASSGKRLLILRPSIIDPAQHFPYRGFCHPMSAPHVIIAALVALLPSRTVCLSSRFGNPGEESTADFVPVDVVVDRLLVHAINGTTGPVHAVAGPARMSTQQSWSRSFKYRKVPWSLRLRWTPKSWDSEAVHPMGQLYPIIGMSFDFDETRTAEIWRTLSLSDRSSLHLFVDKAVHDYDHEHIQQHHVLACMRYLTKQRVLARWMVKVLYRSLAVIDPPSIENSARL